MPLESIQRLEVSRGFDRRTFEGAMLGMILLGVSGFAIGASVEQTSCDYLCILPPALALLGGVTGAVAGGVVGYRTRVGAERWREVPLPPHPGR